MNRLRTAASFAAASLIAAALTGCAPDQGSAGGRIDPYQTTRDDLRSPKANVPSLLEFGDKAAQALAADLADIPELTEGEELAVIELGTILNKTNTPTQDFEQIQRRLRNALRKSPTLRKEMMFVESLDRMNAELNRTQGAGQPDLLQEGGRGGGTDRYDPRNTFVLQGDFSEIKRGNTSRFYMNFQLTNVQSRQIVFNHDYDLGQVEQK